MKIEALTRFYTAIRCDNRISPSHISVYMALFECWNQNGFQSPVAIKRKEVMAAAKISGLATYHKCMRDLHEYGYIRYQPSFNAGIQSRITIPGDEGPT